MLQAVPQRSVLTHPVQRDGCSRGLGCMTATVFCDTAYASGLRGNIVPYQRLVETASPARIRTPRPQGAKLLSNRRHILFAETPNNHARSCTKATWQSYPCHTGTKEVRIQNICSTRSRNSFVLKTSPCGSSQRSTQKTCSTVKQARAACDTVRGKQRLPGT